MSDNEPTPRHLKWLVKCRAEHQRVSADLYEFLQAHPEAGKTFAGQSLVTISFSLWRAAFLADRTGKLEARSIHARKFLQTMLADNAIGYAQDRASREITFSYYLDNARFRLDALRNTYGDIPRALTPPVKGRTAKTRWDRLQSAFGLAVKCFMQDAARKPPKKSS